MQNEKTLYLIELKTDSSSFHYKQVNRYIDIITKNSPKTLFNFLIDLGKNQTKYENLIKFINKQGFENFDVFENIKLIYLAPKNILSKNWGDKNKDALKQIKYFITFEDLHNNNNLNHEFSAEWKIIASKMKQLDEN